MKDYSVIVMLIFFCSLFYFMCLFSLNQQTQFRNSDLRKIVYEICQHNKLIEDSYDNVKDKINKNSELTEDPPSKRWLGNINEYGDVPTNGIIRQSKDDFDYQASIEGLLNAQPRLSRQRHGKPVRCPTDPTGLRATIDLMERKTLEPVRYGGSYRPKNCKATERVAIIVPYRDREVQLEIFVRHMHALLQKQQLEYTIFVVEMALPTQFNRGLLANVGFITAASKDNQFTCFIFHDVDLLPLNETNMYRCSGNPRHMSAKNSKYQYKLPYHGYFGGVVSFRKEHYLNINGFSNMYFGWGAEDDDLTLRLKAVNISIDRKNAEKGYYKALPHLQDTSNPHNPSGHDLLGSAEDRMGIDGVNSVRYFRLALEFRKLYTWVYVVANETEVMENYTHLRSPPWKISRASDLSRKSYTWRAPWLNSLF